MMKYAKIKYLVAFCVAAQVTAACAATTDAQRVKKGFDRKAAEIRTARLHDAKWTERRPKSARRVSTTRSGVCSTTFSNLGARRQRSGTRR